MRTLNDIVEDGTTVALSSNSEIVDTSHMYLAEVIASITAANPADDTFLDANVTVGADTVTAVAHGMTTGVKVVLTTTGTLPAGLALVTDYYLIVVDADTLSFATSQALALAGTAVDITAAAGGGTHTIDVEGTIAGAVKLQRALEPTDDSDQSLSAVWADVTSSSQSFTGTDVLAWSIADIAFNQLRAVSTVTSGTVTVSIRVAARGI